MADNTRPARRHSARLAMSATATPRGHETASHKRHIGRRPSCDH